MNELLFFFWVAIVMALMFGGMMLYRAIQYRRETNEFISRLSPEVQEKIRGRSP